MTFTDVLHYVTVGNPVSGAVISTTSSLLTKAVKHAKPNEVIPVQAISKTAVNTSTIPLTNLPLWKLAGYNHNFIRLAGLSGVSAILIGAAGAHHFKAAPKDGLQTLFDKANYFHFYHSLALMSVPLAKSPLLTGALMVTGTVLYTGGLYYHAFTGKALNGFQATKIGGACLLLAWLTLLL